MTLFHLLVFPNIPAGGTAPLEGRKQKARALHAQFENPLI